MCKAFGKRQVPCWTLVDRPLLMRQSIERGLMHTGHDRHTHVHQEPTNPFAEASMLVEELAYAPRSLEYFLLVLEMFFEIFVIIA